MNKSSTGILGVLALAVSLATTAQIPTVHIKPVPMNGKDTLQQVITSQTPEFEISTDEKNSSVVYKGIFAYTDLAKEPSFSWLPTGIDEYHPKKKAIKYLKNNIAHHKLLVFLGTWCGDSKDLVPKLYKVLDDANISYEHIMVVGMDRAKTTHTTAAAQLADKYKITRLPTIVVLNEQENEVGRITESVQKSIEQDLFAILKGE